MENATLQVLSKCNITPKYKGIIHIYQWRSELAVSTERAVVHYG